ncbi:MAG: hypothetical protein IJZ62_00300 [Clostridia bacterium]|nr:hypothetical protein [Clostridia bacterium]
MSKNNQKVKKKRKLWFKILKGIMRMRYKRPAFVYLDEKPFGNGCLILSNHEGTDAPMSLEIYNPSPTRMWGAHEMNSGLKKMYQYQTKVYYHEKKHWNLHAARSFCLLASPLTNLFYKGLNLISTYQDARLKTTIRESVEAIKKGENVVIYPEDSTNGYLEKLEGFHAGYLLFAEKCKKEGIDLPIYVTYFKKKERVYVIDKPIYYSTLCEKFSSKDEISKYLLNRCNELGQMNFDEDFIKKTKKLNKKQKKC